MKISVEFDDPESIASEGTRNHEPLLPFRARSGTISRFGALVVAQEFGVENDLEFNPDKSAVAVYSPREIGVCRELTIQGKIPPQTTHYKYLEVVISDAENYLYE